MNLEETQEAIISPSVTLKTAMRLLGGKGAKNRVLFVINDDGKLIGSVADGDVRRAILKGIGFQNSIYEVMFKSPRFVKNTDQEFKEKAKNYVIEEKLYAIPVLDDVGRIKDILFWFDFFNKSPLELHAISSFSNSVVIMAGGKGTRLDPFTKILPKPLIPFGERPIIEMIMDNFNKYGFTNFILTLNYKKELIKMYFKENKSPYNVEWVEEDQYLGTAGSLGLLKDMIKETFFVCNCDVFLESDFRNMLLWHKGEDAIVTIVGCHKEIILPYGLLEMTEGCLKSIQEKPIFDMILNTGVYIMEPKVLEYMSCGENIDMDCLLQRVKKHGKVSVYPVCDGWFDLGEWKEYKESIYHLQNKDVKTK